MNERAHHTLAATGQGEEHAREQAWDPVLLGERSASEVAAERAGAGDSAEDVALAEELYAPLSSEFSERLFEQMGESARSPEATPAAPRWGYWVAAAAAVLAVVAGGVLAGKATDKERVAAALPAYSLTTDTGLATARRTEPEPELLRYRAGNRFDWLLQPEEDVTEAVTVLGCARRAPEVARELDFEGLVDASDTGSLRLRGPIEALALDPGEWAVSLIVVPADAEPSDACAPERESSVGARAQPLTLILEP